jgi:PAS domain S-box-containing protein
MRQLVPQHEEHWFQTCGKVASTGEPIRCERRAEALGRTFDAYTFRVGAPESRTVAVLFRDVTVRHEAEAQLRRASARLSYVLEGSSHGFWDWDFGTGGVEFSQSWASILGYEVADLAPHLRTWKRLVHPDDIERVTSNAVASYHASPAQYADEYRLRHKDGRWVWVQVRGRVVERDARGHAVRAAGTCIDVTGRREAEEALRAALAQNEKLVTELREALNNVKTLSGFLPICMHCKKIRDDKGYWERIEKYISLHTDALFSHGLCPECLGRHYPVAD